jgi:ribosomal protein S18 acetylase RimI-like enzyme
MDYTFRFLSPDHAGELFETFLEAFRDYAIDISSYTQETFINRAIKNGIDFESSVGLFDGDRMVGYTLVGTDTWKGRFSAYDIGTGMTKPHRGKGLARGMFEFALPRLRDIGVLTFVLEVLQENEPAIKAYEKAGFHVTREFDCFQLNWEKIEGEAGDTIVPLEKDDIGIFEGALDWHPSWEDSFASIKRVPDPLMIYGAVRDGSPRGLIVFYPALNWIMSIVVERAYRRKGIGTQLMRHLAAEIGGRTPGAKLVNVQHDDAGMIAFVEGLGFTYFAGQYEMELDI